MRVVGDVAFIDIRLLVDGVVAVLSMFNLDLVMVEIAVGVDVVFHVREEDDIVIKGVSYTLIPSLVLKVVKMPRVVDLQVHDIVTVIVDVDEVYFEDVRVYIVFIEDDVVVGFLLV